VTEPKFASGRLLVVAFEGWNDAGEAASGAVRMLKDLLDLAPIAEVDPEDYFDYQFNRPSVEADDEGNRRLIWPGVTIYGPAADSGVAESGVVEPGTVEPETVEPGTSSADRIDPIAGLGENAQNVFLLLGTEPSRGWKTFTREIMDVLEAHEITSIVFLGAMLADVPHSRPISVFTSSENASVRAQLGLERSGYEGPVGILSVLGDAAEKVGISTMSVWASVPHYVHNAPSPKATLAIIDKLEEIIDVVIPRGELVSEAAAWESGIDALAGDDDDMASYIEQLEQARDTVDSPEASGDAIAEEFEKYLRRGGDRPDAGAAGEEPWRPKD
jgi:hypothetical protein